MLAQLVPIDGGTPIELARPLNIVGRKEGCDIRIDHKSISKLHCLIVKTDGLLLLRDLGSTNGTRVNGQRVRRAALLPNDKLAIAHFTFRVRFGSAADAAVSPDEYTQQIEAREVAGLLRRSDSEDPAESSLELPGQVQINPLPDVYPENGKSKD